VILANCGTKFRGYLHKLDELTLIEKARCNCEREYQKFKFQHLFPSDRKLPGPLGSTGIFARGAKHHSTRRFNMNFH